MKTKKTRADSKLGILTQERQAEIAEHARTHTLAETRAWLREDGITIGSSALSEWLSSWSLRQIFSEAESNATEFRTWLLKAMPELSEEQLDQRAALMFQFQAVRTGDADTYLAFASARAKARLEEAKLKQKERALEHDERRIALLEKKAAQADEAKSVIESKQTPEEKQLKLRQIFGMT
jgi:hypothetical protein